MYRKIFPFKVYDWGSLTCTVFPAQASSISPEPNALATRSPPPTPRGLSSVIHPSRVAQLFTVYGILTFMIFFRCYFPRERNVCRASGDSRSGSNILHYILVQMQKKNQQHVKPFQSHTRPPKVPPETLPPVIAGKSNQVPINVRASLAASSDTRPSPAAGPLYSTHMVLQVFFPAQYLRAPKCTKTLKLPSWLFY